MDEANENLDNIKSPPYSPIRKSSAANENNCLPSTSKDIGYHLTTDSNMLCALSQDTMALDILKRRRDQEPYTYAKKMRSNDHVTMYDIEDVIIYDPMELSLNESTLVDSSVTVVKMEQVTDTSDNSIIAQEDYLEANANMAESKLLLLCEAAELHPKLESQRNLSSRSTFYDNEGSETRENILHESTSDESLENGNLASKVETKYEDFESMTLSEYNSETESSNSSCSDIIIGKYGTTIKLAVANSLNWNNRKKALRELLVAVFSRLILATHTLTGRPSPAFLKRDCNPKPPLDANKISDICEYCQANVEGWTERAIRKLITSKCADDGRLKDELIFGKASTSNKDDIKKTSRKPLTDANNSKNTNFVGLLKSKFTRRKKSESFSGKIMNITNDISTKTYEAEISNASTLSDIIDITKTSTKDTIVLGNNGTTINGEDVEKLTWLHPEKDLRKVLLLLFDRDILATHTLTGKKAPAFQYKAATPQLDPKIVKDFENYFKSTEKCKNINIREIITSKCADERKMLKLRIEKNKENQSK